jgi:hypothetical protein
MRRLQAIKYENCSYNEKGWKTLSSTRQSIKHSQRHFSGCAVLAYYEYRHCFDVSVDGYVDIGEKTPVATNSRTRYEERGVLTVLLSARKKVVGNAHSLTIDSGFRPPITTSIS